MFISEHAQLYSYVVQYPGTRGQVGWIKHSSNGLSPDPSHLPSSNWEKRHTGRWHLVNLILCSQSCFSQFCVDFSMVRILVRTNYFRFGASKYFEGVCIWYSREHGCILWNWCYMLNWTLLGLHLSRTNFRTSRQQCIRNHQSRWSLSLMFITGTYPPMRPRSALLLLCR